MRSTKLARMLDQQALIERRRSAEGWLRDTPVGRTVWRIIDGLIRIELTDRAMTLAAQTFSSVLPVIIAASAISNAGSIRHSLTAQLGVSQATMSHFAGIDTTSPTYATFGLIGVVMLLISGTSFARALGRVYGRIWEVEPAGFRGAWRWLASLLATAAATVGVSGAGNLTAVAYLGPPLAVAVEFVVWLILWTLLPYLLTEGRISGRPVWATGVLTAIAVSALRIGARPFLTHSAASAQQKFGALGLVFTLISWIFIMWTVVIGVGVITKALLLDEGWVGKLLRVKA